MKMKSSPVRTPGKSFSVLKDHFISLNDQLNLLSLPFQTHHDTLWDPNKEIWEDKQRAKQQQQHQQKHQKKNDSKKLKNNSKSSSSKKGKLDETEIRIYTLKSPRVN